MNEELKSEKKSDLQRVESFLNRKIAGLEKLAGMADPRASKDFDDQADCFKEVRNYVRGLMDIEKGASLLNPVYDLFMHKGGS